MLFPEDLLDEEDAILERLRRGQPVERLEIIRVAEDGRRIDLSIFRCRYRAVIEPLSANTTPSIIDGSQSHTGYPSNRSNSSLTTR
jgi:hypothetical protein